MTVCTIYIFIWRLLLIFLAHLIWLFIRSIRLLLLLIVVDYCSGDWIFVLVLSYYWNISRFPLSESVIVVAYVRIFVTILLWWNEEIIAVSKITTLLLISLITKRMVLSLSTHWVWCQSISQIFNKLIALWIIFPTTDFLKVRTLTLCTRPIIGAVLPMLSI